MLVSAPEDEHGSGPQDGPEESDWQRRRRLDAVFGDVLPATTQDERDGGRAAGRDPDADAGEAWLRAQVPPHHGS